MEKPKDNSSTAGEKIAIRNCLLEGHFSQMPTTLLANGVLLVLNFWYYRDILPDKILNLWLAFMGLGIAGYAVVVVLSRVNPSACLNQRCIYWLAGVSSVLGLGWGFMASYGIEQLKPTDSYFGVILVAGLVGGATATSSALPIAFKVLTVSTLSPVIFAVCFSEHSGHHALGVACLVYLVVMLRAIDVIHGTLRRSIELGLTNAELIVSLEKQSNTDALTKLMNRRGLNRGFELAWSGGLTSQKPVGLVLCDVDYFKLYNDSLGHQAGDVCLEKIGAALSVGMRSSDEIVARYGGEEFAILITNSTPEVLLSVGERARELIQKLQISHPASNAAEHVTISVGASQVQPTAATKIEELISLADNALYSAKAGGRNCVRLLVPEQGSVQCEAAEDGSLLSSRLAL